MYSYTLYDEEGHGYSEDNPSTDMSFNDWIFVIIIVIVIVLSIGVKIEEWINKSKEKKRH